MNKKMILVAVLAASVAGIGPASAQDHHDNGRRGGPAQNSQYQDRDDHRYDRSDERRNDRSDYHHDDRDHERDHDRGAGPRHDLRKGGRLPAEYRGRQYVVDDWRGHRLSAPPRGYHWVQTGGDYVLVAIATGLIANLLLNN